MKSIKEWMKEKGLTETTDQINRTQFANFMASQTFKVDPDIKSKLRARVNDILNDEEFKDKSKVEMLREFMAVISMMVADLESTSGSVGKVTKALNRDPGGEQIAQEAK